MFTANRSGNNGMIVINDFLQSSHRHGCPSQVIYFGSLFLQKNILSITERNQNEVLSFLIYYIFSFENVSFCKWSPNYIFKQGYANLTRRI
jgi:hypothetical protein